MTQKSRPNSKRRSVTVRLSPEHSRKFDELMDAHGKSITQLVETMVEAHYLVLQKQRTGGAHA